MIRKEPLCRNRPYSPVRLTLDRKSLSIAQKANDLYRQLLPVYQQLLRQNDELEKGLPLIPLTIACVKDDLSIEECLSRYPIGVLNICISACAMHGALALYQKLVARGCAPHVTHVELAAQAGQLDMTKLLLEKFELKLSCRTLLWAVRNKDRNMVRYLVCEREAKLFDPLVPYIPVHGKHWDPEYRHRTPTASPRGTFRFLHKVLLDEVRHNKEEIRDIIEAGVYQQMRADHCAREHIISAHPQLARFDKENQPLALCHTW